MANIYKGNTPCPGCGRTGTEVPRITKDSLCEDCKTILHLGRDFCKERELERSYYRMDDLMTGYMTWYQIIDSKIDQCLRNLLYTFSQFDRRYVVGSYLQSTMLAGSAGCGTSADEFVLPTVTFNAARELCQAIEKAVHKLNRDRDNYQKELDAKLNKERNRIYNEGVKHGRNLLFQLNNGEITADEINKEINKY